MNFKQVEWEKRSNGYFVANMAFGIQLIVGKTSSGKWVWEIGNLSSAFKQGKVKDEGVAKQKAEHAFHLYVEENLEECIEDGRS